MGNKYFVVRGSKILSGFYPNGISGVFSFRRNDFYSFETEEEAQQFINRIRMEVNKQNNIIRWGEKYTKKYQSIARNLWVWKNG